MDLDKFFLDLHEMQMHNYPLAAIWLEKPLQTDTERTVRITEGHKVCVKDGHLVDCNEQNKANYKVIGAHGTISSSELYFVLTNLETNEPLTLKIK
jgi:formylmethanofuran dehydrogenase subunit A